MKRDYDKIAKIEQEIKKKYGEEAIKNPLSDWDQNKEKEYISQIKEVSKIDKKKAQSEKEYYNGFLIDKKLLTRDNKTGCPVCGEYSFSGKNDVYLNKWDCCYGCYIQWVEGREERWTLGWRPEEKEHDDKSADKRIGKETNTVKKGR